MSQTDFDFPLTSDLKICCHKKKYKNNVKREELVFLIIYESKIFETIKC